MSLIYTTNDADRTALKALFAGKDPSWPPPNLTPCKEVDYWHFRSIWFDFKAEAWLGHQKMPDDAWGTAMLFYVGHGQHIDGGFAVVKVYSPSASQRIEYYTWGACQHEFKDKTIGNCLNRYTCTKCGKAYDVDSSD